MPRPRNRWVSCPSTPRARRWEGTDNAYGWVRTESSPYHHPWRNYGTFTLTGKASGYVPTTLKGVRRPGTPVNVIVPVSPRPTISGYVRTPAGAPVIGMSIMRRDVDGMGARGVDTTDEEGYYSFPHDGGVITIYTSGTMASSEDRTFELEADASVQHDFVMPATATVYVDLRTDDGEIPEKIAMEALRTENHSRSGSVLRRNGDRYVIPCLKPGHYHLVFAVRGFETVSEMFTIGEDLQDLELEVRLVKSENRLTVNVIDPDGAPKPDARCYLMLIVQEKGKDGLTTGSSSSRIAEAKTDEDGTAVFEELATGSYSIHCANVSKKIEVPHEETVVLSLEPVKVEPDILYLAHDKTRALDSVRDDLPLELESDSIRVLSPSGRLGTRRLELGENLVFAFKSGYPPAMTTVTVTEKYLEQKKAVKSNVYNEPIEMVFGEAGAVHGIVETTSGKPRARQELEVYPAELWDRRAEGSDRYRWTTFGRCFAGGARTAEDGTFRIRFLPPGHYVITTRRGKASETFEIAAGHDVGPVTLRP